MLATIPRQSHRQTVSRKFRLDSFDWHGLCIDAAVEMDALVSEPFRDCDGYSRGVIDFCGPRVTEFSAFDSVGNPLPKWIERKLLEHCEADIIECVTNKVGMVDIQSAFYDAVGQ